MAENPGDSSGDSEQGRSDANKPHGSKAVTSNLPMVVAPKLGAGEDEAIDETAAESADEGATSAAPANSKSTRFLALAASVAFAAAFASLVGSVSGSSFAHYVAPGENASGLS
jgi:hypothetical protein